MVGKSFLRMPIASRSLRIAENDCVVTMMGALCTRRFAFGRAAWMKERVDSHEHSYWTAASFLQGPSQQSLCPGMTYAIYLTQPLLSQVRSKFCCRRSCFQVLRPLFHRHGCNECMPHTQAVPIRTTRMVLRRPPQLPPC
jgi:hypothetical protein